METRDSWAAGEAYERFMGRWSRLLASRFVSWLELHSGAHWLDVGCGTGALSDTICAGAAPASVVACDPAAALVEYAERHVQHCHGRASFVVAGVGRLPSRPGGYGSIASLLALNFFPDPVAAVREMRALGTPRATVSACVWDYRGGMQCLRRFWDVAVTLDPVARALDEGERFPICQPHALTTLFEQAGLDDVRCDPIEIATEFTGFADYWEPFLGGTGPAPSYVASLDARQRTALRDALDQALGRAAEGVIELRAGAWAVRGTVGAGDAGGKSVR